MTMPPDTDGYTAMLSQLLLEQGKLSAQLAVVIEQLKAVPDHEQRIRQVEQALPINLESRLLNVERAAVPIERATVRLVTWGAGSGLAGGGVLSYLITLLHK